MIIINNNCNYAGLLLFHHYFFIVLFSQGLKHLHDSDMIHMDIKPANIFIGLDGLCKIGDFGLVLELSKVSNSRALVHQWDMSRAPHFRVYLISSISTLLVVM